MDYEISVPQVTFEKIEDIIPCNERFTDSPTFSRLIIYTVQNNRLIFVIERTDAVPQPPPTV